MTAVPVSLHALIDEMSPVAAGFEAAGRRLYLVGGVVRDHLLGVADAGTDVDATTDARPATIKALLADSAHSMWTQGERFGTIGAEVAGRRYEITTHRADAYDKKSRKPVVAFGDDIVEDLSRRDFTVNAMAVDLAARTLIDPHGGAADLKRSVLRTPLDPRVSFSDDPLRMLRTARFHAGYDLCPEPTLLRAITAMADRMAIVSVERIRDELQKLLLLSRPGSGLALLAETGLWDRVIPAAADLAGDPVRWAATIVRVEAARTDPAHRWAALLSGCENPGEVMGSLRSSTALRRTVEWFVSARSLPAVLGDPVLRRSAAAAPGGRRLEELLEFADRLPEACDRLAALRAAEPDLDSPAAALTGGEVATELGVDFGPVVGEALAWLAQHRSVHGPLTPERARAELRTWWADRKA